MSGWYKQQRSIFERAWFKDADMVQLYTFLKAMAYVADGKYQGEIIRRGSCPTTRSEMMEATGMKYMKLNRTLNRLISYGEIIVNANSRFSIITICDYDNLQQADGLFDTTDETSNEITDETSNETSNDTTPNISNKKKEERIEDNLISPFSPYKERERGDVALEIKKRYNKTFDGKLPPCIRLSTATRMQLHECLRRFGLQSVDLVFAQILSEQFSLGVNKTGFIANFSFIFTPKNYQQYLERAQLARKKKHLPAAPEASTEGETNLRSWKEDMQGLSARKTEQEKEEEYKQRMETMVRMITDNPDSCVKGTLTQAYNNGTLKRLGIDWKPAPAPNKPTPPANPNQPTTP